MGNQQRIWLFILGLVLVIASPHLLSYGMFMDGTIYATISRNLSEGRGSIWLPLLTETLYAEFYEHPPLGLYLHSLVYSLLGDHFWIEKILGLATFIINGFLISKIWRATVEPRYQELSWMPALLWTMTPLVTWSIVNNMLESTLLIFILSSTLCLVKSGPRPSAKQLIIPGLLLALGMITKGFVGLFIWSFFFWKWLIQKDSSLEELIKNTLLLIFFTVIPLVILFACSPAAWHHFYSYLNHQVLRSIEEVVTVPHRGWILVRLFNEVLPMLIAGLLIYFSFRRVTLSEEKSKTQWMFFAIGLSGVLPLLITMKQRGFYLLTTFPFFALFTALIIAPFADEMMRRFHLSTIGKRILSTLSVILIAVGIIISVLNYGSISRDNDNLSDVLKLNDYFKKETTIGLSKSLHGDWGLRAYAYRFAYLSTDPLKAQKHEYLLLRKIEEMPSSYKEIKINLKDHSLYKKDEQ